MKTRLVPAVVIATCGALGCEEKIYPTPIVSLLPEGASAAPCASTSASAPTLRTVPPPSCEGRCCPTAMACYPLGNRHSGAECLARRDNATETRWQFRQTFSLSTAPQGLVQSSIADILVARSELLDATCGASNAQGSFIQLIDFDTAARTSRTGFAKLAASEADALAAGGLCMVENDAYTTDHALAAVYAPPANWPKGLPPPMAMPWKVAPSNAVELDSDFTLPDQREALLGRLAPGGDLDGKGGVFYFDKARGYMHGYSPLTYIVNYDSATSYSAIPIREAEMTQWLNDPANPNCSGVVLGDNPALPDSCVGDSSHRFWGCPPGDCASNEAGPTKIQGYFLIAEIEQIFNPIGQTLCLLFGKQFPNWATPDNMSCRSNPKWNALDPVNGLPQGDWCAATNQPAQGDCHDALQSVSFSTFQAFPIEDGTCAPE